VVNRWVYSAFLAVVAACVVVIEGGLLPALWAGLFIGAMAIGGPFWWRYVQTERQEHGFRRTFEASGEAVFSARCGALGGLNYAKRILDRVQATVVTYAMIETAPPAR
jgi:hypothetical protein